jgi:mannose-P-dolichol utilization defect protein 1
MKGVSDEKGKRVGPVECLSDTKVTGCSSAQPSSRKASLLSFLSTKTSTFDQHHPNFIATVTLLPKTQPYTDLKMDSLRSALQPITHNLPAPIHDLGVSILGETCYKTLLLDIDLSSTDCIKLAISKSLGIGIIAASTIVKVPQILKLINSKSSEGISFLSYLLETSAYLISLAYNVRQGFPFSTYGETSLIMAQNVVIAVLVLHYSGKQSAAALFVAGLAASAATLFTEGVLDMKTLSYLQAGAGLLGIASKVPQIAAVWQEGGTGQLSAFAVCLPLSPD